MQGRSLAYRTDATAPKIAGGSGGSKSTMPAACGRLTAQPKREVTR
jgi:hypothetical protein